MPCPQWGRKGYVNEKSQWSHREWNAGSLFWTGPSAAHRAVFIVASLRYSPRPWQWEFARVTQILIRLLPGESIGGGSTPADCSHLLGVVIPRLSVTLDMSGLTSLSFGPEIMGGRGGGSNGSFIYVNVKGLQCPGHFCESHTTVCRTGSTVWCTTCIAFYVHKCSQDLRQTWDP